MKSFMAILYTIMTIPIATGQTVQDSISFISEQTSAPNKSPTSFAVNDDPKLNPTERPTLYPTTKSAILPTPVMNVQPLFISPPIDTKPILIHTPRPTTIIKPPVKITQPLMISKPIDTIFVGTPQPTSPTVKVPFFIDMESAKPVIMTKPIINIQPLIISEPIPIKPILFRTPRPTKPRPITPRPTTPRPTIIKSPIKIIKPSKYAPVVIIVPIQAESYDTTKTKPKDAKPTLIRTPRPTPAQSAITKSPVRSNGD
jgi:hypothetical protein